MLPAVRRIVTCHDAQGRSIVRSDAPAGNVASSAELPEEGLINLWAIGPGIDPAVDPTVVPWGLLPTPGGSIVRFFQIAPEDRYNRWTREQRVARTKAIYAGMGAPDVHRDATRHPAMHETKTVDFIVLLQGEITMMLDVGEVALKPFDMVVQRGTNHAWVNHGEVPALLLAVLNDAHRRDTHPGASSPSNSGRT